MILIDDILISDDVVEKRFVCDIEKCKGACCIEGDFGAPLNDDEIDILEDIYDDIKEYITEEGRESIEKNGVWAWYDKPPEKGTMLMKDAACSFIAYKDGILNCGIELAWKDGKIKFKKPISCELYPIRVEDSGTGFVAVNYDSWSICNDACTLGAKQDVRVYEFLKEPIIRRFGEDFWNQLDAAVKR